MSAVIFSTLQYAKTLQAVGFTKEQSEALSEGIGYSLHTVQDLTTKNELYEVRDQLNQKIDEKIEHLHWKMTCIENNQANTKESSNRSGKKYFSYEWIDTGVLLFVIYMLAQVFLIVMILSGAKRY